MAFLTDPPKLESHYAEPFEAWKKTPNPTTTGLLLRTVQPDIDKAIMAHVGGPPNPILRSRARKMALGALKTYDPTRAKLGTHLVNQLQGLKRVSRQQTQILSIPERVSLDQGHVENARLSLADSLGREPSLIELADKTNLSTRRLMHLKKFERGLAEGSISEAGEGDDGEFQPGVEHDTSPAWHEFVYHDLDDVSRKVFDWTLGAHGETPLSNLQIARKLRLSPGAISQRKAKIQALLDQQQQRSPF